MLDKAGWIICGSAVASVAAVGGLAYNIYTRNLVPVVPSKPVSGNSETQNSTSLQAKLPQSTKTSSKLDASMSADKKPGQVQVSQPGKSPVKVTADKVPSFDIVRVEPTGESVVAGRSEPNADIELLNQGKTVGKTKADADGQFVIIPGTLRPGAHQLQLRAVVNNKITGSKQAVAISVPQQDGQAGSKEVIVALAEPDKPTKILSDTANRTLPAEYRPEKQLPAGTAGSSTNAQLKQPAGSQRADAAQASPAAAGETIREARSPAARQVAALAEKLAGSAASRSAAQPSTVRIRIVEAEEKGGFFVSGFSLPGSRIRLYLNGSYVAEVQSGATGEWSLRVSRGMSAGNYIVRADLVGSQNNTVVSRAQVPFNYPRAVSAGKSAGTPSGTGSASPDGGLSPEARILSASGPKAPVPAIAMPASESRPPAGRVAGKTIESAPGNVAGQPAPSSVVETSGGLAGTHKRTMATTSVPPVPDQRQGTLPDQARPLANRQSAGNTAVANKPVKSGAIAMLPPPEPAAHVVIERLTTANVARGDSLWRISRKILGRGIRYTQIYEANTGQIRDPNKIWPGQVFVVPLGQANGNQADSQKPAAVQ
ncbi:MAG: LysM peptidoglycan-binding domain-containing protein [Beijerinckiaceae bacterium]|nr:LysM peptidoglycan-binding domain-containing protein [Beijerinckiaceae bacterium]